MEEIGRKELIWSTDEIKAKAMESVATDLVKERERGDLADLVADPKADRRQMASDRKQEMRERGILLFFPFFFLSFPLCYCLEDFHFKSTDQNFRVESAVSPFGIFHYDRSYLKLTMTAHI